MRPIESFTGIVNSSIFAQKLYPEEKLLSSERNKLIRSISTNIFDYTSSSYSIGDVYHRNGNFLKKFRIDEEVSRLINETERAKGERDLEMEHLRELKGRRPKKEWMGSVEASREKIKELQDGILSLKKEISHQRGLKKGLRVEYMVEHVFGRDQAARRIVEFAENKRAFIDYEDMDELLRRYAFTIRIEKHKQRRRNIHTKVNYDLERVQKGNTTWENYKSILEKNGYEFSIPKEKFPEA